MTTNIFEGNKNTFFPLVKWFPTKAIKSSKSLVQRSEVEKDGEAKIQKLRWGWQQICF